jgi:hypothetical protein
MDGLERSLGEAATKILVSAASRLAAYPDAYDAFFADLARQGSMSEGGFAQLTQIIDMVCATLGACLDEARKATHLEIADLYVVGVAVAGENPNGNALGYPAGYVGGDPAYCGWFFDWPNFGAKITCAEERRAVIGSLSTDVTARHLPEIPLELVREKLGAYLDQATSPNDPEKCLGEAAMKILVSAANRLAAHPDTYNAFFADLARQGSMSEGEFAAQLTQIVDNLAIIAEPSSQGTRSYELPDDL